MKNLKKLSMVFVLFVATAFTIACEEEESSSVNNSNDCADEVLALADILVDRTNTFNANPTPSTCNSVRTAAMNLLDAAEDCADYADLYQQQTQYWRDLDCNEFD